MSVEVSVKDVRAALLRAKRPSDLGAGEAATLLLGRVFHEVFADLVSKDPHLSGLRLIVEAGGEREQRVAQLSEHTWRTLVAPRLRRHAPALQTSSREVIVTWRALSDLCGWLVDITTELLAQSPDAQRTWERLADLLHSEVPLTCELHEPGWREPVRLIGIADSILRAPHQAGYCAIELKLGKGVPAVDLGQAALYHLILARSSGGATNSALALMRFAPELEEHVVTSADLAGAQRQLLDLVAELAGVKAHPPLTPNVQISVGPPPSEKARPAPGEEPADQRLAELGKRLTRAYREQGVGLELTEAPVLGPRFIRYAVRLSTGVRVEALRRRTTEVQHRLELRAEPLITREAGRLYVDIERPDPQSVQFEHILSQLAETDPLCGSAKVPVGVDPGGKLHRVDLGSPGRSHMLCAGTSGSGKSEWLRMMIAGLLCSNTPETLRLVTLDPKCAAFAELEHSSFLWKRDAWWVPGPGRLASELFQDLIEEMDRRYQLTRASGTDNLREHVQKTGTPLPRIICICDEYFALVAQNRDERREIEAAIALLGAKARAAGIHLVLATQQPSRAIITGVIQANLACRVALTLQNQIESNMILSCGGAERLTGCGDLLYKDFGDPIRLQAPFLPAEERARLFRV